MMKKIRFLALLLAAAVVFAAAGCGKTEKPSDEPAGSTGVPSNAEAVTDAPTAEPTEVPTEVPTPTVDPNATPKPQLINVAANKPVTANYSENEELGPEKLVDEDESTRWSGFNLGFPDFRTNFVHTVVIDLQGEYVLKEFSIYWETLTGYYRIQVSQTGEEESWETVYSSLDYATYSASGLSDYEIAIEGDVSAKYVRIITDVQEDYEYTDYPFCSIFEFELLGYAKN